MGLFDFLGGVKRQVDIFDAGKTYKNKKGNEKDKRSTATQIKDVGFGFLKSATDPFAYLGKTTIINPARELAAEFTDNDLALKNARRQSNIDLGLGAEGTDLRGGLRKWAGNTAQVGLTVAAPGISRGVSAALPNASRFVTTPLSGATIGAPFNVAATVSNPDIPLTKEELLRQATMGAVFGGAVGFGGEALSAGGRVIANKAKTADLVPLNEAGFIGRGLGQDELKRLSAATKVSEVKSVLKDLVPEKDLDRIAPAIVQAKDTNVIRNLVEGRPALASQDIPAVSSPTPVGGEIAPVGKGTLPTEVNRGATLPTANQPRIAGTPAAAEEAINPQQVIMDALNGRPAAAGQSPVTGVRNLATKQKQILSTERGQRFGAAADASKNLSGTEAHIAELKQLKGKYSKVEWNGLKEQLGGDDAAEQVYAQLRQQAKDNKALSYTDGLNTDIALRKLILGEGLPTAGDIRRLEAVFGPDDIDQIMSHVSKFQQAQDLGKQLIGVPRALMASGDISFGGRQALAYATAHPIEFAKQWTKQFKYLREGLKTDDATALKKAYAEIRSHPDYELARKSGLAITDVVGHNPATREEQFISSNLAQKIPLAGRLVRGSDHAFTGLANNIRANSFYSLIEQARQAGYTVDDNFAKQIARVVNNGTGRGSIKGLEKHMGTLSTALFSPRLMLSRLNTLFNPAYYIKTNPVARQEALRQLFGLSAFATGILGMAKAAGLKINTDPTNSDFGKIKVGDSRIDFLGGYAQYIKLASQIIEGRTTSSMTGKESKLGSGYGEKSVKDIIYSFLENKENPVASFVTGLAKGTDITGNPTRDAKGIAKGVIERMVPLFLQDMNDLRTHPNRLNPLIGAPLAAGGVGVQTYGTQDIQLTGKNKEYIDKLKSSGADKKQIAASTEFFQLSKTGPDRDKYAEKIKKALTAGDEQGAIELAKQYNDEYSAVFDDWREKYGQYRNDKTLVKEYLSNRITRNSLLRWYDAIKNPQ